MNSIPVSALLEDKDFDLQLKLITGKKGLSRKVNIPQIQKPGLALTGDTSHLHPGRVQVMGSSELRYLKKLPPKNGDKVISKICRSDITCFVITHGNDLSPYLISRINHDHTPLLKTELPTATFVNRLTRFLELKLMETTNIHGVLVDVFGIGIMLIGKSGIGKSECALELVMKGHRLIADDIIYVRKQPPRSIYGMGPELIKYHMEIRGLGIINIKDLFGVASVRDQKLIELVIELVDWKAKQEYERLGIDEQTHPILGVTIPYLKIPVRPGRNLTAIIEVAARNQLLKFKGFYSAQEFQEKLTRQLIFGEKKGRKLPAVE